MLLIWSATASGCHCGNSALCLARSAGTAYFSERLVLVVGLSGSAQKYMRSVSCVPQGLHMPGWTDENICQTNEIPCASQGQRQGHPCAPQQYAMQCMLKCPTVKRALSRLPTCFARQGQAKCASANSMQFSGMLSTPQPSTLSMACQALLKPAGPHLVRTTAQHWPSHCSEAKIARGSVCCSW